MENIQDEIFELGRFRGYNIASWNDVPEIGAKIPRHLDWEGHDEVTEDNIQEVFAMLCSGAESNGRDYSPFEFTAKKLNDLQENVDFDVWEIFENGIIRGINQNMEERAEQGAFETEEEEPA